MTVVPSVETVPSASPEIIAGALTVRLSPSASVSFDNTENGVATPFSAMVPVSATATGASLTFVTVTVTVPTAVNGSEIPFDTPSSVIV